MNDKGSVTLIMPNIEQYPFIFSNERRYCIRRHRAFWGAWWLFSGFIYSMTPFPINMGYLKNLLRSMTESLAFLPMHIFLTYSLIYFIIPYFLLKQRYVLTVVFVLLSFVVTALLSVLISGSIIGPIRSLYQYHYSFSNYTNVSFALAFMAGLRGGITVGGLAAAIKLMKHWYTEGQRNLQLQKENAEAQLQILKAQVHPHFLFNTLNNIYSKTQGASPAASEMIFGLSDILRYMLYECNKPLVPLSKELKMMEEYIDLEKVRYGNKLELHLELPEVTEGYFVAPLMILPFVENCFKHGTSNILDQPWISLTITLEGYEMTMKLLNSKSQGHASANGHGIGIENAKKRLTLLYPDKHQLTIQEEYEVFIVILKLRLEKKDVPVVMASKGFSSVVN
jgi:sensor histidine kinase YesM